MLPTRKIGILVESHLLEGTKQIGVFVRSVIDRSPAQRAGIVEGDRILQIGAYGINKIGSFERKGKPGLFTTAFIKYPPAEILNGFHNGWHVHLLRNGQELNMFVKALPENISNETLGENIL